MRNMAFLLTIISSFVTVIAHVQLGAAAIPRISVPRFNNLGPHLRERLETTSDNQGDAKCATDTHDNVKISDLMRDIIRHGDLTDVNYLEQRIGIALPGHKAEIDGIESTSYQGHDLSVFPAFVGLIINDHGIYRHDNVVAMLILHLVSTCEPIKAETILSALPASVKEFSYLLAPDRGPEITTARLTPIAGKNRTSITVEYTYVNSGIVSGISVMQRTL
jgi:hypothetical protein